MGRIEHGEQAQQMGDAVHRDAALRYQGHGAFAPLHVQAAFHLRVQLHAGQQPHEADRIGIAQERRDGGNLAHVHFSADALVQFEHGLLQALGDLRFVQIQVRDSVRLLRHGTETRRQKQQGRYAIP